MPKPKAANAGDVIEQRQAEPENGGLLPHVLGQIGEMFDDRQMALWAGELAGWLDEDGYLREGDDEICAALSLSQSDLDAVLTQCRALVTGGGVCPRFARLPGLANPSAGGVDTGLWGASG